jgi:hypothetical protein
MGTPPPTTTTVIDDVHRILDTAKTDATEAIAAAKQLNLGDLAAEARQLLHDGLQVIKDDIAKLFGHGPATPTS